MIAPFGTVRGDEVGSLFERSCIQVVFFFFVCFILHKHRSDKITCFIKKSRRQVGCCLIRPPNPTFLNHLKRGFHDSVTGVRGFTMVAKGENIHRNPSRFLQLNMRERQVEYIHSEEVGWLYLGQ